MEVSQSPRRHRGRRGEADRQGARSAAPSVDRGPAPWVGWGPEDAHRTIWEFLGRLGRSGPETSPPLSPREAEAVGYFLFGDRLRAARELWNRGLFFAMIFKLLPEPPPWATIAELMKPTESGRTVSDDNVRRNLRDAAEKLGVPTSDLYAFALQGLSDESVHAALKGARWILPCRGDSDGLERLHLLGQGLQA